MKIFSDILYLEAAGNYTLFYSKNGTKEVSSYTLGKHEQRFEASKSFIRIHRKYLVNKRFIRKRTETSVMLYNGKYLPISRRRQHQTI